MDLQSIERSSLFSYSVQYFWHKKRSALLAILEKYLKSAGKEFYNICDVGCEIGHDVFQIYDLYNKKYSLKFTGVDINDKAVNIARERSRSRSEKVFNFIVTDVEKDFNLNEKFDVIIASEIIEHLKDADLFLKNLKNMLKEKGIIILSTPNLNNRALKFLKLLKLNKLLESKDYPQFHSDIGFDHISLFSDSELKKLIEKNYLKILLKKRITFFYGNKFLDENPYLFGIYIILDNLFDKLPFLNSFSYNLFYVISEK